MRQKGIVLVPVLLVLFLMSTLVLMQLDNVSLQQQLVHSLKRKWSNQQTAEKLIKQLKPEFSCELPPASVAAISEEKNGWWNSGRLCQFKEGKKQGNYFFTKLMSDPCRLWKNNPVAFWQTTLRVSQNNHQPVILQIIKAYPDENAGICQGKTRQLLSNFRLWRKIN